MYTCMYIACFSFCPALAVISRTLRLSHNIAVSFMLATVSIATNLYKSQMTRTESGREVPTLTFTSWCFLHSRGFLVSILT